MSTRNLGAAICLLAALTTGAAIAHSGAMGVVKERMDAMSDIADQMKLIAAMLSGQTEFDAADAEAAARAIAGHAGGMEQLFPEGSNATPSEAKDEIWTGWDRFTAIAAQLEADASAMAAAGENMSQIRSLFGAISQSCKTCHQEFRSAR